MSNLFKILTFIPLLILFIYLPACSPPKVKDFEPPVRTTWKPQGESMASSVNAQSKGFAIPKSTAFHTMHSDINNSDEVWTVVGPMFELDWVAEQDMYIGEGPTFDNEGNLYFSPLFPKENVSLVSLNAETGERRWSKEGDGHNSGSGAILILDDPDAPGKQIIYHGSFSEVMALRTDGSEIWRRPSGFKRIKDPKRTDMPHAWGMNYVPQFDAVLNVSGDGQIIAYKRLTGEIISSSLVVPGKPTPKADERPPQFLVDIGDKEMNKVFNTSKSGKSLFSLVLDAVFGGGSKVTNFYGVNPNTGDIYLAATGPDGEDGAVDGVSHLGALYRIALVKNEAGDLELTILNYITFDGGTGSTPTISADGSRVMVSDNFGNVIALDSELKEVWRIDVGKQVAASISVSSDNHEMYAITRQEVVKIIDKGDSAEIAWRGDTSAFEGASGFNSLTATITANGIVVGIGGGIELGEQLMLSVGMGILDRETGKLSYFAEGREDSISITSVDGKGNIYTGNSPIRRVMARAFFPSLTPPIIGGVSKYRVIRHDLQLRDAMCAASDRIDNTISLKNSAPLSVALDLQKINVLIQQSRTALEQALLKNEILSEKSKHLSSNLNLAESLVSQSKLAELSVLLKESCLLLENNINAN